MVAIKLMDPSINLSSPPAAAAQDTPAKGSGSQRGNQQGQVAGRQQ